ncbi:MAG: hypothetical protein RLZZ266_868, partial [Bacteroidota bacterium]
MKRTNLYNQGFLWAVLGTILFSTKAILIKLCFKTTNIDASSLLMLRMLFALPFYAAAILCLLNFLYGLFILPESLAKENRREFDIKRANPIGALLHLKKYPKLIG